MKRNIDQKENKRKNAVRRLLTQLELGRTIWFKGVKKQQPLTTLEQNRIEKEIQNIKAKTIKPAY